MLEKQMDNKGGDAIYCNEENHGRTISGGHSFTMFCHYKDKCDKFKVLYTYLLNFFIFSNHYSMSAKLDSFQI